MTAIVDGVAYTSGILGAAVSTAGSISVSSLNVTNTAELGFAGVARIGTVMVGPSSPMSLTYATVNAGTLTGSWTAGGPQGSGTLTITALTATGATGTFAFTAPPTTGGLGYGATGIKTVTNGTFNVTF